MSKNTKTQAVTIETTEKDRVLTEIFNNDPMNILDVSDPITDQTDNKNLADLAVGDQVKLFHVVRGKAVTEFKEISEKTAKLIKIGSLRFDPVSGLGLSGTASGKKISVPTEADYEAESQKKAGFEAFTSAKFQIMELQAKLETMQNASNEQLQKFNEALQSALSV